jgi:hypothetical protein
MDAEQFAFYVFLLMAVYVAGSSYLRISQRRVHGAGLGIQNEGMRRKQGLSAVALRTERELAERKRQLVDTLAKDMTAPTEPAAIAEEDRVRRELESLKQSSDAHGARVEDELGRIDRETEEELERHRQRRRTAVAADVALLVLSLTAAVALVVAALPAFS